MDTTIMISLSVNLQVACLLIHIVDFIARYNEK